MNRSRVGSGLKECLTFVDNGLRILVAQRGRRVHMWETALMIGGVRFHNSSALKEKEREDVFVISFCRLNCSPDQNTARQIDGSVRD